jgi:hypothetical protein
MAAGRPNLRILRLSGCSNPYEPGSYLTDEVLRTIARSCPNLQAIDLSSQRLLTPRGICDFLKACPHLREANFDDVDIPLNLLERTLTDPSTSKLLLLSFGSMSSMRTPASAFSHLVEVTGGRVVFTHPYRGLIEPTGVSQSVSAAYAGSKRVIEQASDSAVDPHVQNEWSDFF